MLILLAPSKTMDTTSALPFEITPSTLLFPSEASLIQKAVRGLSATQIARLMKTSTSLAEATLDAYKAWPRAMPRPALWTYVGDVYKGVKAWHLSQDDVAWMQEHLLIISGLYGLVRPLDEVKRYRLEMRLPLAVEGTSNLYEYWGDKLGEYVSEHANELVINLSSDEYAKVVTKHLRDGVRIVTPMFYDTKPSGVIAQVPIYSKMMRGVMAHWMIDQRIETADGLVDFLEHGYCYDSARSKPNAPAFTREVMIPLKFE